MPDQDYDTSLDYCACCGEEVMVCDLRNDTPDGSEVCGECWEDHYKYREDENG